MRRDKESYVEEHTVVIATKVFKGGGSAHDFGPRFVGEPLGSRIRVRIFEANAACQQESPHGVINQIPIFNLTFKKKNDELRKTIYKIEYFALAN